MRKRFLMSIAAAAVGFIGGRMLALQYRNPGMSPADVWHSMPPLPRAGVVLFAFLFYGGIAALVFTGIRALIHRPK